MPEEHRNKIKFTEILNRLEKYVMGTVKMEAAQVTAALGLLRKVLPDLAAMELKNTNATHEERVASLADRMANLEQDRHTLKQDTQTETKH